MGSGEYGPEKSEFHRGPRPQSKGGFMKTKKTLYLGVAAIALAALLAACLSTQGTGSAGANDIGGVVAGPSGPEAGVWVIAETSDLPTKFAKLVVTDDRGRFLIPDLPKANYSVWVRGYGLVDSPKVSSTPGKTLNLTAVPAPSAAAAAEFYPGMYWYSMINIPARSEFPGTGEKGNGISSNIKTQEQWIDTVKNACQSCHSLGSKGMRTVPKEFGPGVAGWARRTQSGQALTQMALGLGYMGADAALKNFADWTDRIAAGELPHGKPGRPQGVERNMVVTMWDFSTPKYYLHDGISTDRDNPRLNANGPIYGAPEESTDMVPVLDPVNHRPYFIKHPVNNPKTPSSTDLPMQPSAYWGKEPLWDGHSSIHNAMMDSEGRVWFSARIRPNANPDFCKKGSDHPSAQVAPQENSFRQLSVYDPKMGKGFGRVDQPGYLIRIIPGANPSETALSEVFVPPDGAWSPRGIDMTSDGVVWTPLASGHIASFDRRKCKGPLNGPAAASGKLCAEGWTLYRMTGPQFKGLDASGSANHAYYLWVDRYNSFGLGANVPIAQTNGSESLMAVVDGKIIDFRVPYPLGFFTKNVDGRIDDAQAGWKGRAMWTTSGTRTNFHNEGGTDNRPKVYKLQLRPDPLAR